MLTRDLDLEDYKILHLLVTLNIQQMKYEDLTFRESFRE